MTPRKRTCLGLVAVGLATIGLGVTVWRGTALDPGEMVLGSILLSSWVLSPTLLHFDGLRRRRYDDDGRAQTIAIVAGCAAALAWSELVRHTGVLTPSWGYAVAPLVVLLAGTLTHRALRGQRLSPAPPPAGW